MYSVFIIVHIYILISGDRYLDKFSELLYLPGFTLIYYEEPI